MDYHSFKLQTSANTHRDALLYSLSKRPLLMESELSRTPVKIKNFTFTHDKSKIVINDMTNISTPQQCEYSFQYADIPLPLNTTTVLDVYNNNKEWDMVTVRGKVLSVNQPRAVGSPKKRLKLMEATLADKTGSIPLDLWESNIDQIKEGAVYSFNQVQVRVWSSRKKRSHKFLIEQFKVSILSLPKCHGLWFVLADFLCHLTIDQIMVTYLGVVHPAVFEQLWRVCKKHV